MKKSRLIVAFVLAIFLISGAIFWTPISNIVANINFSSDAGEPDMPSVFKEVKNELTREEYLIAREEGAALRRGIADDQKFDPKLRPRAIVKMEAQEAKARLMPESARKDNLLAAWTAIGPAPIPNGQTTTNSVAVTGRTTAIAIHPTNPNIVYVGTAQGGVYRTTDGGTSWTPIFDSAQSLAIGALAIAPSQAETLYVGTGEPSFSAASFFGVGLYRIDAASTTATLNGPFGAAEFAGRAISEIIVHPTVPGTIFLSSTSGIGGVRAIFPTAPPARGVFRSTNATTGAPTFVKDGFTTGGPSDHNVRDIAIDPTNPNILLIASTTFGIIRLTNALTDFTTGLSQPCPTCGGGALEITSQRSGGAANATFYVVSGIGSGRVVRSTNGGVTWTTQSTTGFCSGQCSYNLAVAVDPTDPNNMYVGGQANGSGVITGRSTNAGVSFTTVNTDLHADTHAIEVAPSDPTQVWTGNDGGIWKSTDSGASYTSMNVAPFSATQFMNMDIHPTDANFTIGGTQDNGTNFYNAAGVWSRADFGDGGWAVIDQNAADTTNVRMYHTYFNVTSLQGYGTVNNTANASDGMWNFRGCQAGGVTTNGITCNGSVNFYAPLERGPGNPNTIYYGSDRLYRSDDEGVTHTVVSQNPIAAGVPISAIAIAPGNDNVRMVGLNNGGIFGTSTGASPLVDLDPGGDIPNNVIGKIIVDPASSTTVYVTLVAFGQANVWRTTNVSSLADGFAPTWTDISGTGGANPLPQVPVNAIVRDPMNSTIVYVGTDIGVYYSPNSGANWFPFGTGLPRVAVFDIKITNAAPRMVRVATHGKGLYQTPAALAPTAANASIGGRVLTSRGRSLYRVYITLTDATGQKRVAISNSFGYYKFEDVQVGETYTITASHKRYDFSPRVVNLEDDLTGFDITSKQ